MRRNKDLIEDDVLIADELIIEPGDSKIPRVLPVLPVRDQVYFPNMLFPLLVGREKSIKSLDAAIAKNRKMVLIAQKDIATEDPEQSDLYEVGLLVEIMQVLRVPDGAVRLMLEGIARVKVTKYVHTDPFLKARIKPIEETPASGVEMEALRRNIINQFELVVQNGRQIPPEAMITVVSITDPSKLCDTVAHHLGIPVAAKQDILETVSVTERLDKMNLLLAKEVEILEIHRNIRSRVEKEMSESQKEFILREQLKAIQQELGDRDERTSEIEEYKTKIADAKMPETVSERAIKEVDRLEKMPFGAPDGVVVRNYLDWLISLPWSKSTDEILHIDSAETILNEDHYGLAKVKERILEFLAVRKLAGTMKGPILCFAGPPGVGKTSIGKSIARALGRKFIRVSLGGIRDEAEIRGHRRTYIGAMPGRIIQGIKQTGFRNPVFMLDEIDKIGQDFRGDPSSALLEALDPEQNNEFSDHYLEVPFDLTDVMFITTANVLDTIPHALRDRMEVIHFPGYIEDEKLEIARHFLLPKQIKEHGMTPEHLEITDESLHQIIREHTREAGVRNLEREIATICRKIAKKVAEGNTDKVTVGTDEIETYLGKRRYHYGVAEEKDEVGAATGLVYTEVGGDIVQIEVGLMKSPNGKLLLTGQLGDVMKESAQAALTYVRTKARTLDIDEEFCHRMDIHIHVPAGAVPKDGPSAGVTLATALASALTKRKVRKDVAMTGEITLRGRVLPIGGLKEKLLAAHRAGIKTVIVPKENEKDLEEIPDNVRAELTIKLVEHADEVLEIALMSSNTDK